MIGKSFRNTNAREWPVMRLMILFGLVLGIGISLLTFQRLRDIRGKASAPEAPKTLLAAPYLRLETLQTSYPAQATIPVDVYLHTNDLAVMETKLVVDFDPQALTLSVSDILSTDVFKTINVEPIEEGRITFSLFINPTIGHQPVKLAQETKIATLNFQASKAASDTQIDINFVKGKMDKSALVMFFHQRVEQPVNLLNSVEGITLDINP